MSIKDKKNLTLAERLKRLFVREEAVTPTHASTMHTVNTPQHKPENVAFKAGAAVTFITPIGAYAGNTSDESLRKRAEQQFYKMDTSQNTTIN